MISLIPSLFLIYSPPLFLLYCWPQCFVLSDLQLLTHVSFSLLVLSSNFLLNETVAQVTLITHKKEHILFIFDVREIFGTISTCSELPLKSWGILCVVRETSNNYMMLEIRISLQVNLSSFLYYLDYLLKEFFSSLYQSHGENSTSP